MRTFAVNEKGDIIMNGGDFQVIEGDDELIQAVRQSLRTIMEEWELNQAYGFPLFNVLGEFYEEELVNEAVFTTLYQIDRVGTIKDIQHTYDRPARRLYIKVAFTSQEGEELETEVDLTI